MEFEDLNIPYNESLLINLKKYLNYQISSALLFALSFFWIILIFIAVLSALLFIPYSIYVLYKNKDIRSAKKYRVFSTRPT